LNNLLFTLWVFFVDLLQDVDLEFGSLAIFLHILDNLEGHDMAVIATTVHTDRCRGSQQAQSAGAETIKPHLFILPAPNYLGPFLASDQTVY